MSRQSAGGKAAGIKSRKRAIEKYYLSPNICLFCSKTIIVGENQLVSTVREKKFCNRTCAARFNNKKFIKRIKKENPVFVKVPKFNFLVGLTINELFIKHKKWQNARSTIQRHARYVYQNSDKLKKCYVCGYQNHYEVCHIKAVKDFDKTKLVIELNHIDNLIALCPNHHWEFDNGILPSFV